jgi:predicted type IV restriction endonuclease
MSKKQVHEDTMKALFEIKDMIELINQANSNEAETRRRIERVFASLMGYDVFKHITREHSIRGVGDTEHCDFAVVLDKTKSEVPCLLVEIKRVGIALMTKHLKQASSYAINIGCEWILLTNSKEWRLYHVSFGQPPQTTLVESWNILEDEPSVVLSKFNMIGYQNIRKGKLDLLWKKRSVLTTDHMLDVMLSEGSISMYRRALKRKTDVTVTPEEIVGAVRRLLNEASLTAMDNMRITLPETKKKKRLATLGENKQET